MRASMRSCPDHSVTLIKRYYESACPQTLAAASASASAAVVATVALITAHC